MDAFNRVKVWFMVTGALVVGMILFIILFPTIRAFFWSAAYSPGTSQGGHRMSFGEQGVK